MISKDIPILDNYRALIIKSDDIYNYLSYDNFPGFNVYLYTGLLYDDNLNKLPDLVFPITVRTFNTLDYKNLRGKLYWNLYPNISEYYEADYPRKTKHGIKVDFSNIVYPDFLTLQEIKYIEANCEFYRIIEENDFLN
jgi:hypothetical protein